MDEKVRAALIAYLHALNLTANMDCYDVDRRVSEFRDKDVAFPIGRISVEDGASKICMVFHNFPFVLKWDTDGYGEAMQEVSNYRDAVTQELAFFFPKTELFYEYNGLSFVLQEKIDCAACDTWGKKGYPQFIQRVTKTPTDRIYKKMQKDFNKVGRGYSRTLDESWAKTVISLYGKKVAKALCQFIIAHEINDLHSSNIGYKNFRPIILDFSGYHR